MAEEERSETGCTLAELGDFLVRALSVCVTRGMELPLICVAAAVNGSLFAVRYERTDAGLHGTLLAEHNVECGFVLPINIMIVDQTGEAVRAKVDVTGSVWYHWGMKYARGR
jgi:hypothetical protein